MEFSPEGAFLQAWDGVLDPQGPKRLFSGVAVDENGGLWVIDTANDVLLGP